MILKRIRLLLLGFSIAFVLWIIESIVHAYFFNYGTSFVENLIPSSIHELWMRSLTFVLIILFSIYVQILVNKIHMSKTLLKVSENKYREAYHQTDFYKDLFTHDMNNILQNIQMSVELSEMSTNVSEKSNKSEEMMGIIKDQVARGFLLVSNVRKFTSLYEDNKSDKLIDLKSILGNAIDHVYTRFQKKPIDIKFNPPPHTLVVKAGDLLLDAFENILLNGAMHNSSDIIKLTVKSSKMQISGDYFIKIEFLDNGVGIADKNKEIIFERSNREGKSSHGMGIGLSLVKNIINKYGGKIWVENLVQNQHSKGSNFIVLFKEFQT